jgi:phosphoribosyl-ATP pyrophosphohydrolase
MHKPQIQQMEFLQNLNPNIIGREGPKFPSDGSAELAAKLIEEEAEETVKALRAGDLVGAVDGLADLLYVAYQAANSLGVDIEVIYDEVHANNLTKIGGPIREDGKRLKPPGWVPPDIAGALARCMPLGHVSATQSPLGTWTYLIHRDDTWELWVKETITNEEDR